MPRLEVVSPFSPAGDQGRAIALLTQGVRDGLRFQTLKGVTGSGKTFAMAKIIEEIQLPTLVLSHNKTLAAQLYREFVDFFPHNAVEYFVSYYDYYQPEAYVPGKDLYIEKDASINREIERMRLSATTSLMERRDVIVVATVSCIYGLGNPEDYREMRIELKKGESADMREIMRRLVGLQYERNDAVFERSRFRVRGDVLEIYPSYAKEAVRIEFFGDEIERIRRFDPLSGNAVEEMEFCTVYPAKYFVMPQERLRNALQLIRDELQMRCKQFADEGKLLEAERIRTRTEYDLEMMEEMGYCSGIENYSRPLSGRRGRGAPCGAPGLLPPEVSKTNVERVKKKKKNCAPFAATARGPIGARGKTLLRIPDAVPTDAVSAASLAATVCQHLRGANRAISSSPSWRVFFRYCC